MKLQILSDLHIDSYARRGLPVGDIPQTDSDIIILAGDISNSSLGMKWAIAQAEKLAKPIIYIAGNHEYFEENTLNFDDMLSELAEGTGVIHLQKSGFDMDKVRFLGCTLWTDFTFGTQPEHFDHAPYPLFDGWQSVDDAMQYAKYHMRDYMSIRHGSRLLSPELVAELHAEQKHWLRGALKQAQNDDVTPIAITHHSISALSIAQKYALSKGNGAFVSDFSSWMMSDFAPTLWVHGHTHDAFDYTLGKTRVVVNPRAYPSEVSSTEVAFDWAKVIEV